MRRENREYQRAGVIAAAVLNAARSKRSDKTWTAEDIFPHLQRPRTAEEFAAALIAAAGGDDNA